MDNSIIEGINNMMAAANSAIPTRVQESKPISLTDRQREIVESDAKNIIVAAGAGSGKTRVLIERIKYLINSKGVDPSSIVAITFTNMAADEMRERLVDVPGVGDAFIGTIHSFANLIYKSSGYNYSIYNDEKDSELHHELIEKYCKFLTFDRYLMYRDMVSKCELGLVEEGAVQNFLFPSERSELTALHKPKGSKDFPETIHTLCEARHIITFDQLLNKATEYFKSIEAEIEYVLVDELQDVGSLEYKFITSLQAHNYFYVGDDWQAIYAFKGGNVGIFKSLMRDKSFTHYRLEDNFRNGTEIIELGKRVIDQVPGIIRKSIRAHSDRKGSVTVDSKYKLDDYLRQIKEQGNYGDWFILLRTNREVYNMNLRLAQFGIPSSVFKKSEMTLSDLRAEMSRDAVKVLTIHTAKGLESPNVLMVGKFPLKVPSYCKNSDERKVMYVGLTRAEENLIILN